MSSVDGVMDASTGVSLAERQSGTPVQATTSQGTGQMSFPSAVFNLTNTIIGSGILTMPYVFAHTGWLLGNMLIFLAMGLIAFSAYLLTLTSGLVPREATSSFEALGYQCCGIKGSLYAEITFIIGGVGTLTGYLVFISKLLAQVIDWEIFENHPNLPMVAVVCLVILPLAFLRKIDALKHASVAAIVAIAYVVFMYFWFCCSIGEYDDKARKEPYKPVTAFHATEETISAMNLLIGAFCVQNTCLPIYKELADRSPQKMLKAILCSMALALLIYEVIGLSGYILLGGNVQGNSLADFDNTFAELYPWTSLPRDAAKVFIICILCLSTPLALWPCRSAICSVVLRAGAGCRGPARGYEAASDTVFRWVTVGILATVVTLAIATPDVTVPLSLVNSLAGGSMIFIMPGAFHLTALTPSSPLALTAKTSARVMVFLGGVCCVVGFTLQVQEIHRKYGQQKAVA